MDYKIWEVMAWVKGFLHYCWVNIYIVTISNEDKVYIMGPLVPKDFGISKCNLHSLQMTTSFAFVIKSVNRPNLGCCSSHLGVVLQTSTKLI
jgi:hypothetical protein